MNVCVIIFAAGFDIRAARVVHPQRDIGGDGIVEEYRFLRYDVHEAPQGLQ